MRQADLFLIQPAPRLDVARFEAWPFPGLTAHETAQCVLAKSAECQAALAATILATDMILTEAHLCAAMPQDWKDALGPWLHGNLAGWAADEHGIEVKYVCHDGAAGFHFEYKAG